GFLSVIAKLILYGQDETAADLIRATYQRAKKSAELMPYACGELAAPLMHYYLEKLYDKGIREGRLDWAEYTKQVSAYDFKLRDDFQQGFTQGLIEETIDVEKLRADFPERCRRAMYILSGNFLKLMRRKNNINFSIGGIIWDGMWNYWNEQLGNKRPRTDRYFDLDGKKYEAYLIEMMGEYLQTNIVEMMAVLWGAQYVYDFLNEIGLLPTVMYDKARDEIARIKSAVKRSHNIELWKYALVHGWQRPDSVAQEAFDEEKQLFAASITVKAKIPEKDIWSDDFNAQDAEDQDSEDEQIKKTRAKKEPATEPRPVMPEKYPGTGRNQPCPCRSGRKYKKCCGLREVK
ncbi:MAG: SEC-C metal-binding domain-containing protein, partial [Candidatus Edwardsbacteria bacterium]|nr:SEC-C metal-binding domain-containing protein [Candidatus Edwardsbacteria bacterium]